MNNNEASVRVVVELILNSAWLCRRPSMAYYFFPPTRVAVAQISELFDFVWPTAAALWNLRWQVSGFLQEVPKSSPVQLNDRFVFGSKIHGTNLKKACVETTWQAQKHQNVRDSSDERVRGLRALGRRNSCLRRQARWERQAASIRRRKGWQTWFARHRKVDMRDKIADTQGGLLSGFLRKPEILLAPDEKFDCVLSVLQRTQKFSNS